MNKKLDKRKSILLIVLIILFMLGGAFKFIAPDSKINNIISETQDVSMHRKVYVNNNSY